MVTERKLFDSFVNFLRQFTPIPEEDVKRYLIPVSVIRNFSKKEIITRAGEVENYMNFIVKGLVRKYYMSHGEEKVVQISIEGHLVSSQESFFPRTPSEYFVEAIEPTTLISIHYDDIERIFDISHNFERLGRLISVHTMVLKDKWQISLVRETPRDRFLNFVESYPEILQRVPQKYLASYLNIKPETFSRFKHLVMEARTSR